MLWLVAGFSTATMFPRYRASANLQYPPWDSNPHTFRHEILSLARLPITTGGHLYQRTYKAIIPNFLGDSKENRTLFNTVCNRVPNQSAIESKYIMSRHTIQESNPSSRIWNPVPNHSAKGVYLMNVFVGSDLTQTDRAAPHDPARRTGE